MYLNVSTEICASGSASRSGSTVTISGSFGVSQGNAWNLNAIYACVDGGTSWMRVKPYSNSGGSWSTGFSFSFTDSSAGSRTYTAYFAVYNNAESGSVGNWDSVTFTVSYPAASAPPSGHNISNVVRGIDNFTLTGGITSWGIPNTAGYVRFGVAQSAITTGGVAQYTERITTKTGTVTVSENSTKTNNPTFSINPNTMYHIGIYATNNDSGSYGQDWTYTTLPPTTALSNSTVTETTADFLYSVPNQGGKYNMDLKYQLDSGSPVTVTTLTGSGAKSGSFTVSNLSPGTTHTLTASLTTNAGETTSNTVTFSTLAQPNKLYGSVNNLSKEIIKLYGAVEKLDSLSTTYSQSGTGYIDSVNTTLFIDEFLSDPDRIKYTWKDAGELVSITLTPNSPRYDLTIETTTETITVQGVRVAQLEGDWGITVNSDGSEYAYFTPSYIWATKEINKLYGSVNGLTKQIY